MSRITRILLIFCLAASPLRAYDRHNTGGFSSAEHACGDPFDPRSIETCCVIAWMALSVDMLELSDDPQVADELELTTWNAFLGAQHPSGRWFTYDTPMVGERKASAHQIVFQALAGRVWRHEKMTIFVKQSYTLWQIILTMYRNG